MTSALRGLFLGALLVLLAYASAWADASLWGTWAMILGCAIIMAAATAMGALNSKLPRRSALFVALFLFALVAGGFGAPLFLSVETVDTPLVFGLPMRAAIEIYGVGLLPIVVLPLIFAKYFRSSGLDEASLAELRRKCAELGRR